MSDNFYLRWRDNRSSCNCDRDRERDRDRDRREDRGDDRREIPKGANPTVTSVK